MSYFFALSYTISVFFIKIVIKFDILMTRHSIMQQNYTLTSCDCSSLTIISM